MFGTPFSLLQTLLGKRFLNLIFLFVLIGLGSTATTFDTKVSGQSATQSCPTCRPPTEQTIYAPLIKLNGSFNTEINLNCRSPYPIDVVPTFYTESGLPITGETIRLAPAEMRFVDIRSLIPAQFLNQYVWGGVSLSYTGNLMEVWAQLTIRGVSNKGSANTLFAVVDARRSNTQQAVWRMPRNATATIAMGNYSNTPAGATLTFSNGDVEQIILAPYAAKVISRKNNGQNSTDIEAESVRVEASGQIGRLITTGVIVSNNGKYASSLRFYDKENTFQPNLYSTNFRLKNSTPYIVLKNTTGGEITARPRFLPRTGEGSGVIELPAVTLQPNAVKELNLTTLINAAATRPDLDSVAVQIINSGVKGSLIGAGNFTDDVTGVDYDIPLRDSGSSSRSAGAYPIRLDGDYSTTLSLTNTGNVAGKFTLQINYAGGTYALYPQAVAPGATASFDFRQIRDRQTPDSSGRVLPVDFTIGQIRWSMVGGTATTLIGRSEIISKLDKVSSSYSCNICCRNSYESSRLTPNQVFEFLGGTSQMTAMQKDRDCYNNYFAEYEVSNANWSSSNASIVDFYGANGVAYALDTGNVLITATWETQYFLDSGSDTCDEYPVIAAPTGDMTVVVPTANINTNTYKVSQVIGNQNIAHFVVPKGITNTLNLTATLDNNTQQVLDNISWEGATESANNPLDATVSTSNASKNIVKIKFYDVVILEIRVWVVWATISSSNIPIDYDEPVLVSTNPYSQGARISGGYNFTHTIQPSQIITDADRPNLSGVNANSPPGGNHPIYGTPLSGGVNAKWDNSRQIRLKIINPAGINPLQTPVFVNVPNYPTDDVEGNDDQGVTDPEQNNPYSTGGTITGVDKPTSLIANVAGAENDTYELRIHFREFTRLEIEGVWYKISDFYPWRIHIKFKKASGKWIDDGTNKALDNAGF